MAGGSGVLRVLKTSLLPAFAVHLPTPFLEARPCMNMLG